jgi:hypothetical protein
MPGITTAPNANSTGNSEPTITFGKDAAWPSIKSPTTLTPFGLNLSNGRPVVAVVRIGTGARVRVSDVGVAGPVPCGLVSGVIATQGATLELGDTQVSDMVPADADCPQQPKGHAVGSDCHRSSRKTERTATTRSGACRKSSSTTT